MIETEHFYKDITKEVERKFDTSKYSKTDSSPLPIGKNKKVKDLMKDGHAGIIMKELNALRVKMYAYRKLDKNLTKIQKSV